MISEEIKNIKESKKDLRKFGITVGIVLLIIAGIIFWNQGVIYIYFGIAGAFLVLSGIISPGILRPVNKIWMTLAILMGWVMTRVILTTLFYLVLTPISFTAKIFGNKFLAVKIDKDRKSYWEIREKKQVKSAEYERQF